MRITLGDLIDMARVKYELPESHWDITPKVDLGDYGDGPEWENIYLDVQKKPEHKILEWRENHEI